MHGGVTMSSLWTPGGEIPIDRDRPDPERPTDAGTPDQSAPPGAGTADPDAQMEAMRRQLLEAPAGDVIAQHLLALYELAALHLSADAPRLDDARAAIDAVEAVLQALPGRLGEAEGAIASALPQLKMAFVEAKDRLDAGTGPPV